MRGMEVKVPTTFTVLLHLYPRSFRLRFGCAMSETFVEELGAARRRGRHALASTWARALLRMPLLALEEHMRNSGRGGMNRRLARAEGDKRSGVLDPWSQDLRFAMRSLKRAPGFAVVTILTVGLGMGATTSLFSLTNALMLKPLAVTAPEELVRVQEERTGASSSGIEGMRMPYARYEAYEEATRTVFSGLAAHDLRYVSMRVDGPAFSAASVIVSGNYFEVLGVRPAIGRFFTANHEPSVVLGYRLWQQRFLGSTDVIGRPIHVNGQLMTIVGVAAPDFGGTVGFISADLWLPHGAQTDGDSSEAWVLLFGRLRPGVGRAQAATVMNAVSLRLPPDAPNTTVVGARLEEMTALPPSLTRAVGTFLGMLLFTALLVLIVASANIAGMLLARGSARGREVAIRMALGAGRGRLVRQLLTEIVLLFLLGGGAGLLLTLWVTRLLSRLQLPMSEPVAIDASPDLRVLAFAFGLALVTGLLFGFIPALRASHTALVPALKDGDRGVSAGGVRARGVFVSAQLAVSVLLLIVAALFVRTLQRAMLTDPGFTPENVVVVSTNVAARGYDEQRGRAFYRDLITRVRALADVESASLARVTLLTGESEGMGGWRAHPDGAAVSAGINAVDGAYFETLRIELRAGRGFEARDVAGSTPVVVVNQRLAERLWPGENPIGRDVLASNTWYQVIGVARNGTYVSFGEEPGAFAFISVGQRYTPVQKLHVRMRPGVQAADMIAALRNEVASLDPDIALERPMPMGTAIAFMLAPQRFAAFLVGIFGLVGLFLAGIGVYGVLSQYVMQRWRELGIRVALGADTRKLLHLVLGRGAFLVATGCVAGLVMASALTRLLQGFLFGVHPLDPVTFASVPVLLGVVALLATCFPARRALRVNPMQALRQE